MLSPFHRWCNEGTKAAKLPKTTQLVNCRVPGSQRRALMSGLRSGYAMLSLHSGLKRYSTVIKRLCGLKGLFVDWSKIQPMSEPFFLIYKKINCIPPPHSQPLLSCHPFKSRARELGEKLLGLCHGSMPLLSRHKRPLAAQKGEKAELWGISMSPKARRLAAGCSQ